MRSDCVRPKRDLRVGQQAGTPTIVVDRLMTRTESSTAPGSLEARSMPCWLALHRTALCLRFPLITAGIYPSHTGVVISATTSLFRTFHVTVLDLCVFKTYDQRHSVTTMQTHCFQYCVKSGRTSALGGGRQNGS